MCICACLKHNQHLSGKPPHLWLWQGCTVFMQLPGWLPYPQGRKWKINKRTVWVRMNGILTGVLWNLWEVVSSVPDPQILTQGLTWRSSEKSLLKNKTSEESTPSLSECCFSVGDSIGILDRTFFIVQDCLDHWRTFRNTPLPPVPLVAQW